MKITDALRRDVRAAIAGARLTEDEMAKKLGRDPAHFKRALGGSKALMLEMIHEIGETTGHRVALVPTFKKG